jgi:RecA-family ATPase
MSNLDPEVVAELARIKRQRTAREHRAEGVALAVVNGDRQELSPDVEGSQNTKPETKPESLKWLDMSKWDDEPVPERKWTIKDRAPINQAGLFSGEGGTGKSIIELMKDIAHVAGKDWLGSTPERGPAFYIGAEDDEDEIHIRLTAIARHHDLTFKELIKGGLYVRCLLGEDATLCAASGKSGKVEATGLYRQLYEAAGDIKPRNISIDTLSRAFSGNEIDRVQVYAFAMHMQKLAKVAGGSVTVLSHPSLQGISSGSGISGSTAWHGAFRFRQYLKGLKAKEGEQPEDDLRELEFKKNQYGPTGEAIMLRYQRGLFLPEGGVSSLDKLAREQKAEETFLALLSRYEREGRNVSHKSTAPNYAPASYCEEKEANGLRKEDFAAAMRRLFTADKIHVENYGRPSRPMARLRPGPPDSQPGAGCQRTATVQLPVQPRVATV